MKISNIIIIAYLTLLFCGIFVLFFATKNNSISEAKLQQEESKKWNSQEKALEQFSVVVAEPGARLVISTGEQPKMTFRYKLPDTLSYQKTYIHLDTLFVFPYQGKVKSKQFRNNVSVSYDNILIYGNRIKSVIGKEKSALVFSIIRSDTLNLKLYNAWADFAIYDPNYLFKYINIEATRSIVNLRGISINCLNVQLDSSSINKWDYSGACVAGSLKNFSKIELENVKNINIEADSTSSFRLIKPKLESIAAKSK